MGSKDVVFKTQETQSRIVDRSSTICPLPGHPQHQQPLFQTPPSTLHAPTSPPHTPSSNHVHESQCNIGIIILYYIQQPLLESNLFLSYHWLKSQSISAAIHSWQSSLKMRI